MRVAEFEVYFKGKWVRAYLEIDAPAANVLLDGLRSAQTKGATIELNALPTTSTRLSSLRVAWPVVEIVGLPAPVDEDASSRAPRGALVQSRPC